ncbi:hypothetical protein T484DRAFT_1757396 [Baffinella frigidus]|nr:hypothetical protein T484DRAFT_1757396 [Cryptophyta sp. CCMP2293]
MYCSKNTTAHCPSNSESPQGSRSVRDCTCKVGWQRVSETGGCVRTTPPQQLQQTNTSTTVYEISFSVVLAITAEEFDTVKRGVYVSTVANAFSVTPSDVVIESVVEKISNRRILTTTIIVETIVNTPVEIRGSVSETIAEVGLDRALTASGFTVSETTGFMTSNTTQTTPIPSDTPTERLPSSLAIIISIFGGLVGICLCVWVYTKGDITRMVSISSTFKSFFRTRQSVYTVDDTTFNTPPTISSSPPSVEVLVDNQALQMNNTQSPDTIQPMSSTRDSSLASTVGGLEELCAV